MRAQKFFHPSKMLCEQIITCWQFLKFFLPVFYTTLFSILTTRCDCREPTASVSAISLVLSSNVLLILMNKQMLEGLEHLFAAALQFPYFMQEISEYIVPMVSNSEMSYSRTASFPSGDAREGSPSKSSTVTLWKLSNANQQASQKCGSRIWHGFSFLPPFEPEQLAYANAKVHGHARAKRRKRTRTQHQNHDCQDKRVFIHVSFPLRSDIWHAALQLQRCDTH